MYSTEPESPLNDQNQPSSSYFRWASSNFKYHVTLETTMFVSAQASVLVIN